MQYAAVKRKVSNCQTQVLHMLNLQYPAAY